MYPFRKDILLEHADEAAFLYRQRGHAQNAWNQTLESLAELEERLLAHLDGLVVAGEAALPVIEKGLAGEKDDEAFVSAFVALCIASKRANGMLLEALKNPTAPGGLTAGMALAQSKSAGAQLAAFAEEDQPQIVIALALDALTFRGVAAATAKLAKLLGSDDPRILTGALTAGGRTRGSEFLPQFEKHLHAADPGVAGAALRAAVLCGLRTGMECARSVAEKQGPRRPQALWICALLAEAEDERILRKAAEDKDVARVALLGLGRLGMPASAGTLVDSLALPARARVAAHALETIFGVDIEAEKLTAPAPAADAKADPFAGDPDEDLPLPDSAKMSSWWMANSARLSKNPRARMRHGEPFRQDLLMTEAERGRLPDRNAAILECLLRVPGVGYYEVQDWVKCQQANWGNFRARVAAALARAPAAAAAKR